MLHVACQQGADDIVKELLRYETLDLYVEDLLEHNALYYAFLGQFSEILKILTVKLQAFKKKCLTLLEGDVREDDVLLRLLLLGEIPDDLRDGRALVLHDVLAEPGTKVRQG